VTTLSRQINRAYRARRRARTSTAIYQGEHLVNRLQPLLESVPSMVVASACWVVMFVCAIANALGVSWALWPAAAVVGILVVWTGFFITVAVTLDVGTDPRWNTTAHATRAKVHGLLDDDADQSECSVRVLYRLSVLAPGRVTAEGCDRLAASRRKKHRDAASTAMLNALTST
jgi:hypothetical protein